MATRVVLAAAVLWAATFSYLAIARHDAFESNAFDLGYVTQTLWNTVHGEPFVFTTVDGVPFSPEGTLDVSHLRRPHSLLAFHVEPILLLVAPIFAVWPDPRLLLVLQAIALAAGGVGAAALAGRRLGTSAAFAFGLAYLLSPSIAAPALSDFHGVSLAPALIFLALCFFDAERPRLGFGAAILAAATREDTAILIASLGAYLFVRHLIAERRPGALERAVDSVGRQLPQLNRQVPGPAPTSDPLDRAGRPGLWLLLVAGAWALLAFGAIIPFFNGTISMLVRHEPGIGSVFWHRYAWLGPTPVAALIGAVVDPGRWIDWLLRPDVLAYLATLLLSAGVAALAAPGTLAIALPIVLENTFSSFDWMRSGGAHYSVILVPVLLFAGMEGTRSSVRTTIGAGSRRPSVKDPAFGSRQLITAALLAILLIGALANHLWLGASPLAPGYDWPTPGPRQNAVEAILATIPPDVSVSATSAVYPHLASRARAYWFPALNGADVVALDVASSTSPIGPTEVRSRVSGLLAGGEYRLAASAPGFLLLRRAAPGQPAESLADLPNRFYDFARAPAGALAAADRGPKVTFGGQVHLDGYRLADESTQTVFGPSGSLTTYWHADGPEPASLSFRFYLTRRPDGAIVGALRDQAPEPVWYPPDRWKPGEEIQMTLSLPRVRDLQAVGVAIVDATTGSLLPIQAAPGAALWENGTIVRIARLDGGG